MHRLTFIFAVFLSANAWGQKLLDKQVLLEPEKQTVQQAMSAMEQQGGFYFSYNSALIAADSLVSIPNQRLTPFGRCFNGFFRINSNTKR